MPTKNYNSAEFIHIPIASILHRKYHAYMAEALKPFNLLTSEIPFLYAILHKQREGMLQDDIIRRIGVTKSVATRVLQTLEEKKYIKRVESAHSKRHKLIIPTKKVFEIEKELDRLASKWHEKVTASLSNEEINELNRLIIVLGENAREFPYEKN